MRTFGLLLVWVSFLTACDVYDEAGRAENDISILAYGEECAERIAPVRAFNCAEGVLAEITVDGVQPQVYTPQMTCDRPSLLPYDEPNDGQCNPWSMALVLVDNSQVQITAFCRTRYIRPEGTNLFDEIDIIAHSVTSGSTCWFHAEGTSREQALDGTRVPPPNEAVPPPGHPAATEFWWTPEQTASKKCGECHDNDPFYYSPYIGQTGQMPADPFGRYTNDIGAPFQAWAKPQSLVIRGNTCIGCHRIGALFTCGQGAREAVDAANSKGLDDWAKSWPHSHWMPLGNQWTERQWNEIYQQSLAEIESCCATGEGSEILPAYCDFEPVQP